MQTGSGESKWHVFVDVFFVPGLMSSSIKESFMDEQLIKPGTREKRTALHTAVCTYPDITDLLQRKHPEILDGIGVG